MICYSNNGFSMRMVVNDYTPIDGEFLFEETPTTEQLTTVFSAYYIELLYNVKITKENTIKALLLETDYKAIKWAEGQLTDAEYAPIKSYRESLRNAYNTIETATTIEGVEKIVIPTL